MVNRIIDRIDYVTYVYVGAGGMFCGIDLARYSIVKYEDYKSVN